VLPFGGEEPTLGLQGGFQGIRSGGKSGTKSIPHSLEDVATTLLYDQPEQLVVAGQRRLHGPGIKLPEPGGACYVGEQKGDSACGRDGHYYPDVLLASLKRTL
jgi:hypothetical protein